ncbi:Putative secreted metallopeptidase [Trichoderma ghanense]|uniref:Secreted metallopeptidase n=1 Tax=Trichoderma ghanense TaxID=65468 RepID=A0ABY2GXU9_9HYPO
MGASALASALIIGLLSFPVEAAIKTPWGEPFKPIDPQEWANPDDMTWDDYKAPPGTQWNDPSKRGASRNFNIALLAVDYADETFVVTREPNSTVFGNPLPLVSGIDRADVPAYYRDLLNKPSDLNRGHTLHEYWMGDSHGRYGVDLTAFGPYRMPRLSYEYGVDSGFNPGACPEEEACDQDIRTDAYAAWRAEVGNDTSNAFELVFILSAGQDESSTWQEFGEMRFSSPEDVPAEFGPPQGANGTSLPNYAATRYVPWTSWASASTIWPNAGGGSSTQCESSGMGTYAHELSHLLNIGDNYNNPYGTPLRRSYTGPFSMMSRGSFNGPGGPHTRYQIPALQGGSLGSLHTVRDKLVLGLISNDSIVRISRDALAESGPVVATITARSVVSDLIGLRVDMDQDRSPACNISTDVFCDGGRYNMYDVEVIDRMGADSFQPDSGVMISKSKTSNSQPFQWTIDANPKDIELVDFIRPNGTAAMITLGDYRQLADALFHAGTDSGSKYEYVDEANGLHFYILDVHRDETGVLSYTVGARSLTDKSASEYGIQLESGVPFTFGKATPTTGDQFCEFELTNNGTYVGSSDGRAQVQAEHLEWEIFRLEAEVEGAGWKAALPNAVVALRYGETAKAYVAVGAEVHAKDQAGVVTLRATSESDPRVVATARCMVRKSTCG